MPSFYRRQTGRAKPLPTCCIACRTQCSALVHAVSNAAALKILKSTGTSLLAQPKRGLLTFKVPAAAGVA